LVTVLIDGVAAGSATADASTGAWSWTPDADLASGVHVVALGIAGAGGDLIVEPARSFNIDPAFSGFSLNGRDLMDEIFEIAGDRQIYRVDGGQGNPNVAGSFDTLRVTGTGLTLNLDQVIDVEQVDLLDGGNTVNVTLDDMLHLGEGGVFVFGPPTFLVSGGVSDTVNLDEGFTATGATAQYDGPYDVYSGGGTETDPVELWIKQGMAVNHDGQFEATDADPVINAGLGFDTLTATGPALTLNLDNVSGIEQIELGDEGNTLNLTLDDLLRQADTPVTLDNGNPVKALLVSGGETDTVNLLDAGYVTGNPVEIGGTTYDLYFNPNASGDPISLLIEQGLQVVPV
jgi:hypothetical protein